MSTEPNGQRGPLGSWLHGLAGLGPFAVIWSGQLVTLVGNVVLRFAFVVHAWTTGRRASEVVALAVCAMLPQVLVSPTAGALVDRWSKRTALQVADLVGLVTVGALTTVYFAGQLQLWELYLTAALLGVAAAFQYPALASAIPLLVRKDQLQRANGLMSTATSAAEICGPALAGVLVATAGLGMVLWVDLVTFVYGLITIWAVRFPESDRGSPGSDQPRRRLAADSMTGLRYLFARPSLRGLTIVIFVVNLTMVFGYAIVQPMILARTGNGSAALATVLTSIGVGGIVGGLVLGAWGGPRSKVRGMMLGVIGMCLTSQILTAVGRDVIVWSAAFFVGALFLQIVNSAEQAIIQTKVPMEQQGRVFGAVAFVSQISAPVAMIFAGLLADRVFERQAATGDGLVGALQSLVGTGPGSGMAAMLLIAGVCGALAGLWGLVYRPVRDLDRFVPDADSGRNVDSGPEVRTEPPDPAKEPERELGTVT